MTNKHHDPAAADLIATSQAATVGTPDAGELAHVADDITTQLIAVEAEVAELKDAWLRAKAETDNVRKIAQADVAKAHKYAIERFAEDLLPVMDALEQTLAAGDVPLETLKAGAELTLKALHAAFDRAQVAQIAPGSGDRYDPHQHQAMQMVPIDAGRQRGGRRLPEGLSDQRPGAAAGAGHRVQGTRRLGLNAAEARRGGLILVVPTQNRTQTDNPAGEWQTWARSSVSIWARPTAVWPSWKAASRRSSRIRKARARRRRSSPTWRTARSSSGRRRSARPSPTRRTRCTRSSG